MWEWVLDEWTPQYRSEAQIDPVAGGLEAAREVESISGRRTIRGASFGGTVVNLRTRWRDSHEAANAREFVGFRCVYPAKPLVQSPKFKEQNPTAVKNGESYHSSAVHRPSCENCCCPSPVHDSS